MAEAPKIKCVVVGDGGCGKTSLLISFAEERFPEEYVPTVFDNMKSPQKVDGRQIIFDLWDTAGQEAYERLRILSYPNTDVFLICFSIGGQDSFKNTRDKWWPEITHHCTDAKLFLIGTKTDLRNSQEPSSLISPSDATQLAEYIQAIKYMECSSKERNGVVEIFHEVARSVLGGGSSTTHRKKKNCILL